MSTSLANRRAGTKAKPFKVPVLLRRAAVPVALVVLWQAAAAYGLLNPQTMPAPSVVATSFWQLIVTGQLWPNLWISLERVLVGLGIGVVVGTAMAVAAELSGRGPDV